MNGEMECKSGGFLAFVVIFCMIILAIGLIMAKLENIEKDLKTLLENNNVSKEMKDGQKRK